LQERGVGAAVHYPQAVHQQPAYRWMETKLPETERAVREVLSLPVYPEISNENVEIIAATIKDIVLKSPQ